jgi:hypothetical protein
MPIKKYKIPKSRTGGKKHFVAGLQGTKTVVVKLVGSEKFSAKIFDSRELLQNKGRMRVNHLRLRNIFNNLAHTQHSTSAETFPGKIVVPEQRSLSTLILPKSFASSSIFNLGSSKWLIKKASFRRAKAETGSPIQIPQSGTLSVDSSLVYYPTEISLNNEQLKVPVLFQKSKYLDKISDIWKLNAVVGYGIFKKYLDKSENIIDESFIINAFQDCNDVVYTNYNRTVFFDVLQPKFVEKYGELRSLTLLESLAYLTIDDLEQLAEKTVLRK